MVSSLPLMRKRQVSELGRAGLFVARFCGPLLIRLCRVNVGSSRLKTRSRVLLCLVTGAF